MGNAIIHSSKCVFECKEIGAVTSCLKIAIEWVRENKSVDFSYNGIYVGKLHMLGHFNSIEEAPENRENGDVIIVGEDEFYVETPDEMLFDM